MKDYLAYLFVVSSLVSVAWCGTLKDANYHPIPRWLGETETNSLPKGRSSVKASSAQIVPEEEKDPAHWHRVARNELIKRLEETFDKHPAKHIIFFLGDGMPMTTVTAARIRKGQLMGRSGEEEALSVDKFSNAGFSRTYCANAQVPDSACTSTAYMCGVKANIVTLGVPPNVVYNNCTMSMNPDNHLTSIADWAQREGKSTGFITTTTLTHASPSGMYAKVASRFWESDADIPEEIRSEGPCMDIAQQLIKRDTGRNLDVIMGGGMGKFLPNTVTDAFGKSGERADGQDLLQMWKDMNPNGALVSSRDELLNFNVTKHSKIMGIFASTVMNFHALADAKQQPTLAEMTKVGIEVLRRNKKGSYLFVEGGLIDYGNHFNRPYISLDETLEMDKAIGMAMGITNTRDTLIVVTSDHGHPLTISGFPKRGTDILGLNQDGTDKNGVKYTTLNYAIGTEQYLDENGQRYSLEGLMDNKLNFVHPSQITASIGTHSGEDVAVFAHGAQSHLFRGVMQQHTLPHLMAYAACLGDGPTVCKPQKFS